jgi:hypothetical protein
MNKRDLYNLHEREIKNFYKEIELGTNGVEYVKGSLKYGNTLSQALLKMENSRLYDAKTFVHVDVADEKLNLFEQGGISRPVPEMLRNFEPRDGFSWGELSPKVDFWLVPLIQDFLSSIEDSLLILEDNEVRPDDPWLRNYPDLPVLTYEDEVYYYLSQTQSGKIKRLFSFAKSWTFMGMLTSLPEGIEMLPRKRSLTKGEIELLAERAERVIVAAYDHEGYIICRRGSTPIH